MKYVSGFKRDLALSYCAHYVDHEKRDLCLEGVMKYEQYGGLYNTRWH